MEKILKVHSVNDYADYIGAPRLHPLVSVIHYDELEHCRHSQTPSAYQKSRIRRDNP